MTFSKFFFLILIVALIVPFAVFGQGVTQERGIVPCEGTVESPCNFDAFVLLIQQVIDFLLTSIAMPVAALSFAYAGYLYLTAAGNEGQAKKAIGIFTTVAYGIIFALAAWLLINLIVNTLLRPGLSLLG
ncbi:MAG: hypothetical protein HY455_02060 [Parcubacteria group bacterium]|nr:hypothetical protein [Parcubacteria group bacterium]